MVLVMSLWDDHYAQMDWLDSQFPAGGTAPGDARGPCKNGAGDPAVVEKQYPNSKVAFSDVRHGELGSTVPAGPGPSPGPSPSGCPGGSLSACMGLCPSDPPAAYKACVEDCVKRCS
jgi:cellulose 1,4-beta-cellobiosidase